MYLHGVFHSTKTSVYNLSFYWSSKRASLDNQKCKRPIRTKPVLHSASFAHRLWGYHLVPFLLAEPRRSMFRIARFKFNTDGNPNDPQQAMSTVFFLKQAHLNRLCLISLYLSVLFLYRVPYAKCTGKLYSKHHGVAVIWYGLQDFFFGWSLSFIPVHGIAPWFSWMRHSDDDVAWCCKLMMNDWLAHSFS